MICEAVPMEEENKGVRYWYWLHRDIAPLGREGLVFVLLNPSTAIATIDDPTIRRCMGFAAAWGYREPTVVNLFAIRATKPKDLIPGGNSRNRPEKPSRHTMGLPSRPYGDGRLGKPRFAPREINGRSGHHSKAPRTAHDHKGPARASALPPQGFETAQDAATGWLGVEYVVPFPTITSQNPKRG